MPTRPLLINVENWLPTMATIWLFAVLDSYIVWNSLLSPLVRFLPALVIFLGTFFTSKKLTLTKSLSFFCILLIFYDSWVTLLMTSAIGAVGRRVLEIFPMLCILLWPKKLILKTYHIIRKVVIFFAVGSSIVSVLILIGFGEQLPHFILPPREALHVRIGMVYYLYGFFIADCDPVMGVNSRACGMLQEPGHFAVFLGFIYIIERLCNKKDKLNPWIPICGILTFSSAFILIALFTEVYQLLKWKNLKKVLLILPLIVAGFVAIYQHLPSDIKDQVEFLAYGRNLESVVEAYNETSSLTGALDERANDDSAAEYERMTTRQRIVGKGPLDRDGMLSDYRGLIFQIGIIGLIMSMLLYIMLLRDIPIKLKIALAFAYFLVFIHRSWMLFYPYIYFLAFLAVTIYRVYDPRRMFIVQNNRRC